VRAYAVASPARITAPPRRAGFVERPLLLERLAVLTRNPLTVVHAPTGYGKTVSLARWCEEDRRTTAWATVSPAERSPKRFWALVSEAIAQAMPDLALSLRVRRAGLTRPASSAPRALARLLAELDDEVVLVLDQFEQAGPDCTRALERFLALVPDTVYVVVSTRREPELSLPLRRARGELGELREDDLGFGAGEAAQLVEWLSGAQPARPDVEALCERTEGWPAGIHLAALQGGALPAFSGASRVAADYLRQELLDTQPTDAHRDFLLRTSILDRLTGATCDALLPRTGSRALLDELAADGSFLVALDAGRSVFRFRRPAREFLQAELARVDPESVPLLRRRAAAACERAGRVDEAIVHARTGEGQRAAAGIARRHALDLARSGRTEMLGHVLPARHAAVAEQLEKLTSTTDIAALLAAAERVTRSAASLPSGPLAALTRQTGAAARSLALLLAGRLDDARACADPVEITLPSAARAETVAVASLASGLLGLHSAAAPLARSAAAACRAAAVQGGDALALVHAAEAAVAGDERLFASAAEAAETSRVRALVFALLARQRAAADPAGARAAIAQLRRASVGVDHAPLLDTLAAEVMHILEAGERRVPLARELSAAELRVLRLLASRLTQREIAGELFLSQNTIKTHTRCIYRKLDVAGREAAVRAARELNLV
jgi:ATP/maltotriose-dependent transcriptional regulator MalT